MYLGGSTVSQIAAHLTESGVPTPAGKKKWTTTTIFSILQNEKYSGQAHLQKGYTVSFLTKERKKNEGELPSYWVDESHPAIVSVEVYDLVQAEIAKHKSIGAGRSGVHPFSSMVFCGECGGVYGSKLWQSTSRKYRRTVWQCNQKYKTKGKVGCHTPHLTTEQLEFAFVTAFNQMLETRDTYFEEYGTIIEMLTDTAELDAEVAKLNDEVVDVYELIKRGIEQNARIAQSQTEYGKSEAKLQKRYAVAKARLDEIAAEKHARTVRREKLNRFLDDLRRQENLLTEFDSAIFRATVDRITVHAEQDVVVTFREGTDIHVDVHGK